MQLLCSLGHGGPHSLNPNLQLKEQMLRKALIMYLGVASEYTGALSHSLKQRLAYVSFLEPEITVVLSPIITTPRQQDRATRFIGE